jgi:hypothetical protein
MDKNQIARPHALWDAMAEQLHQARQTRAELVIDVFLIPGPEQKAVDGFGICKGRPHVRGAKGDGQQRVSGNSPK